MSVRQLTTGGALGLGGIAAGHGATWIVASAVLVILLGTLGVAELGATAPLRRLWRVLRRLV